MLYYTQEVKIMAKEININMSKSAYVKKQEEAMRKLGLTDEEIKELMAYDKEVNNETPRLEHDLTGEKAKYAQEITRTTGKRKTAEQPKEEGKKKPTVYQLDNKEGKRSKKKNATKGDLIAKLAEFMTNNAENVEITNAERQIAFTIGENKYELTLVQKRK
jgi:hypothetical protein